MAIDRDIIKQIFNNTRKPATGWVSPVVDGYKADQCGEFCKFDLAKAKAKLAEAALDKGGKITLSYNADASHKGWTEATCNSIKGALGVDCVATPVVDFSTFRTQIGERKMKGMFRTGWQMDYPSIENFLAPIFKTGRPPTTVTTATRPSTSSSSRVLPPPTRRGQQEVPGGRGSSRQRLPAIPMWYSTATWAGPTRSPV